MQKDLERFHQRALSALNAGNYPAAAEAARSLLQLNHDHADGWFIMGMDAMANLRMEKALALLNHALALDAATPE